MNPTRRVRLLVFTPIVALVIVGLDWWIRAMPSPVYLSIQHLEGPSGAGRIFLTASPSAAGKSVTTLTPAFAGISGPETSFDGLRILFAGKRTPKEPWQIWEIRRDGAQLRQVTHTQEDCTQPHYLPDDRIVFCRKLKDTTALFSCRMDGSDVVRITYNRDPIRDTLVLDDGRILFSMRGQWATVNTDGTGVASYTGAPEDIQAARARIAQALHPTAPRPRPTGHVSVVDTKKKETGLLFCLNAYFSDRPSVSNLPDGAIRKVRIWMGEPAPRVLGDAPVEKDGSFLLDLPADTPLRFQLIDAQEQVVAEQRTWIWVRPNENRGCIGCHEDRRFSPENQVPLAIRKTPVRLMRPPLDRP